MRPRRKCRLVESNARYEFNEKTPDDAGFIRYIYHFIMILTDSSVEDSSSNLNVYVLTSEEDQHLFELWEQLPRSDDFESW